MTTSSSPSTVTIRTYQVGFGDCFLLSFQYSHEKRHMLIDFGTNGTPDGNNKEQLLKIAKDIRQQCGSKLHVVVATHRHKDHIDGFATNGDESSGKIIADCRPDVVIQPWTEDPDAPTNAEETTQTRVVNFTAALTAMQAFAERSLTEAGRLDAFRGERREELAFAGENNLPNKSAVMNLMKMAKTNLYVNAGLPVDLEAVLPGVKVLVLGPPTLKQSADIRKERRSDPDEFWLRQAEFWKASRREDTEGRPLFGNAVEAGTYPLATRWFTERAAVVRGEELLELVRILDKAMNNTSVILLLEFNGKRLLFPGDAQIENWEYALGQQKWASLLGSVNLYKVGHHASRNATPKSLWKLFDNKSASHSPKRLRTVVSTMAGKYGTKTESQVPRETLVTELKATSDYFTTQELTGNVFYHDETM